MSASGTRARWVRTRPSLVSLLCAFALVAAGCVVVAAPAFAATTPVVTGLSRHQGPYWGANQITVQGSNLDGATKVLFGGIAGYGLKVLSSTELTVFDPWHNAYGTVHVRVVTPVGTSTPNANDGFTFLPPTMNSPIMGGLTARQEQRISVQVRASHKDAYITPWRNHWTPAMGVTAAARAQSWLGLPYSWAGGNSSGPTPGVCAHNGGDLDCHVVGFDCSGLSLYAWSPYEQLVHYAATQYGQAGKFHPRIGQLMPGDLVFFSGYIPNGIGHEAVYTGDGMVVQAAQSGTQIMRSRLADVIAESGVYRGATRPMSTGRQGPVPRVVSLTKSVSVNGGYVKINGSNLFGTTTVNVGGTMVYKFLQRTPQHLVVKVPPHGAGTVSINVSNAWGTAKGTLVYGPTSAQTTRTRPAPRRASPLPRRAPRPTAKVDNGPFADRVGVDWYLVGRLLVDRSHSDVRACLDGNSRRLTRCLQRAVRQRAQ